MGLLVAAIIEENNYIYQRVPEGWFGLLPNSASFKLFFLAPGGSCGKGPDYTQLIGRICSGRPLQ